jgi:hypothetical protein
MDDQVTGAAEARTDDGISIPAVILVVLIIVGIQLALPDSVTVGPLWLIPLLELTGIPIVLTLRAQKPEDNRAANVAVVAYLIFLAVACVMNALLLLVSMLQGDDTNGTYLLFAGFGVLAINVLSFGLIYWWLDSGGPVRRARGRAESPDFLFPQQATPTSWRPGLIDYLFTAYTNIIAFSPTDTMPLTHRVKVLFTIQSATALLTIVVTLSRAINLIPGGMPGS